MRTLEETFNFGLQSAWCCLGAGFLPALNPQAPPHTHTLLYLSVLEITSYLQNRSWILQNAGKVR